MVYLYDVGLHAEHRRSDNIKEASDIYVTYDEMLPTLANLRRRKAGQMAVIMLETYCCVEEWICLKDSNKSSRDYGKSHFHFSDGFNLGTFS